MTVAISVGTRFPAYATSMGRVLLAALPPDALEQYLAEAVLEPLTAKTVTDPGRLREILAEVAAQGYAIVDQELEEGLRAVAAPIRGAAGHRHRGDQRLRARQPGQRGVAADRHPARAAGDRTPDRGRSAPPQGPGCAVRALTGVPGRRGLNGRPGTGSRRSVDRARLTVTEFYIAYGRTLSEHLPVPVPGARLPR